MLRKLFVTACLLSLAIGAAWAGDAKKDAAHGAAGAEHMQMMMQEMLKCSVCKNMAPAMAEIGADMTMDVARLNDGVAMMHGVKDPAKAATFHAACAATEKAGMACMSMTDDQAKAELCGFCQGIRNVVKAGAKMSTGQTKLGDIMVITSADPAVKAQIDELAAQCEMMSGSM